MSERPVAESYRGPWEVLEEPGNFVIANEWRKLCDCPNRVGAGLIVSALNSREAVEASDALALSADLRAYADREVSHSGLVLAHRDSLLLAAELLEAIAGHRPASEALSG